MTTTARTRRSSAVRRPAALPAGRLDALRRWRPTEADIERRLPVVFASAVILGLVAITMLTPIAGRGDYGQWLMTSRFYLGEPIPGYRDVPALPPFVPLLLAAIRILVPDPVIALQLLNGLLLAGLGATMYLLGTTLLSTRWGGVLSVVIGLIITDRFLELFAFGGLLQSASITFMGLSVVSFVRAGRAPQVEGRWWLAGVAALGLAVLSHVATGLIAVPVGVLVAALVVIPRRHLGWRVLANAFLPLVLGLVAVAGYAVAVLLPASAEYVTNPASLAYRGPDRLFSSLFSYWPTSVAVVLGAAAIVLGSIGELSRRRAGGYVVLFVWVATTWGSLAYSMLSGAATDYPRFATVLLAPLVVAAAGGVAWLIGALAGYLSDLAPRVPKTALAAVAVLVLTVASTPFAVGRYERQAVGYQPRDAQALTSAALAIEGALAGQPGVVLTDVRDGKWVEGLTGRDALFSLPVRYAFRPIEWQRSLDADALLRSTTTLTSGLVTAMFINRRIVDGGSVPFNLLVRVNHGGEFVDMLRINPALTDIGTGKGQWTSASRLSAVRVAEIEDAQHAAVTTVWAQSVPRLSFVQRTTAWMDGAALEVRMDSRGHPLRAVLSPPEGYAWTVSDLSRGEATVCLPLVGGAPPCARIWVGQARVEPTSDGSLRVLSAGRDRIDVLVTALTAGKESVGLDLLDPSTTVATRDVRAALLWTFDPSFQQRVRRLESLGFHPTATYGPYQVLLRTDAAAVSGR